MSAADRGWYAPELYSGHWMWIGVGLLVAVVLWYAFVFWYCAERTVKVKALSGDRLQRVKSRYLEQVGVVVHEAEIGDISTRTGHQRLSLLVRHFVQEAGGSRASTMTLTDLNRSGNHALRPISVVVARLYPGEFAADRSRNEELTALRDAAVRAREVISSWT